MRDIGDAQFLAFSDALRLFFTFQPKLLSAVVVLLNGLFVGRLVAGLLTRERRLIQFDRIADKADIDGFLRNAGVRMDPARVVGELAQWAVYLIFFQVAAAMLGVPEITAILNLIVAFIPRIIVALVIRLLGALAANFVAGLVRSGVDTARISDANLLDSLAHGGILAFAVVSALSQLEIAPEIVNTRW